MLHREFYTERELDVIHYLKKAGFETEAECDVAMDFLISRLDSSIRCSFNPQKSVLVQGFNHYMKESGTTDPLIQMREWVTARILHYKDIANVVTHRHVPPFLTHNGIYTQEEKTAIHTFMCKSIPNASEYSDVEILILYKESGGTSEELVRIAKAEKE